MELMDTFMLNVLRCLAIDLTKHVTFPLSIRSELLSNIDYALKTGDVKPLRLMSWPEPPDSDPYFLKVCVQLRDFLKRHIFVSDLYSTAELEKITNGKYFDVQASISRHLPLKMSTFVVCQKARSYVKEVLGPYRDEETFERGRFSTKACCGFTGQNTHLFNKLAGPITGSAREIEWFQRSLLKGDPLLSTIVDRIDYSTVESLRSTNVPKSYKIKRGICPNTLIGSYRSYGIGKTIEDRLEQKTGISLARQPNRHKRWARRASVTRKWVTADLSSASHCFTSAIINRLTPRDWYNALSLGRIKNVTIGDCRKTYYQESFMAMGIGFTFPLQTLLFWAIIKSVQTLLGNKGLVSVFGDDLIYPREIHPYVVGVLTDLGFQMNADKTFVQKFFRESCGGDYCRGVDVRPAMPEVQQVDGKRKSSVEFIKVCNSLTARWTHYEIPSTVFFIQKAIAGKLGWIPFVPEDLPDFSGLKRVEGSLARFLHSTPVFDRCIQSFVFPCLSLSPSDGYVPIQIGYYWDKLRALSQGDNREEEEASFSNRNRVNLYGAVRDSLRWTSKRPKSQPRPKNYRSRVTGKRIRMLYPYITDKQPSISVCCAAAISIVAS